MNFLDALKQYGQGGGAGTEAISELSPGLGSRVPAAAAGTLTDMVSHPVDTATQSIQAYLNLLMNRPMQAAQVSDEYGRGGVNALKGVGSKAGEEDIQALKDEEGRQKGY